MNYGRISYDDLLNGMGTHGQLYSSLHYILGDTLANSNGHGTARVGSLWAKHTLKRSQEVNLYGQIQYDQMLLRDDISGSQTYRHLNNWTTSVTGDMQYAFLSGAVTTFNVGWTTGRVIFDNESALLNDAQTTKTQGSFSKWNTNLSLLQNLNQKNSLYLTFASQRSNGNLDPSEKMAVGGPYSVEPTTWGRFLQILGIC